MWVCETNRGHGFLDAFYPLSTYPRRVAQDRAAQGRDVYHVQVVTVGLDYLGALLAVKIAAR